MPNASRFRVPQKSIASKVPRVFAEVVFGGANQFDEFGGVAGIPDWFHVTLEVHWFHLFIFLWGKRTISMELGPQTLSSCSHPPPLGGIAFNPLDQTASQLEPRVFIASEREGVRPPGGRKPNPSPPEIQQADRIECASSEKPHLWLRQSKRELKWVCRSFLEVPVFDWFCRETNRKPLFCCLFIIKGGSLILRQTQMK